MQGTLICAHEDAPTGVGLNHLRAPPRPPREHQFVTFRVAAGVEFLRFGRMASKYVPSVKDAKAHQRFQQKQHTQSKFIKPATKPAAKKAK